MYARLVFATAIILLMVTHGARAEMLGGGPVYGGPVSVGGSATCRVFNFGAFSVTLPTRQIFTNTNASVPLFADSCNVPLGIGQTCAYSGAITGNFALSCRLIATGTDTRVSGMAEIQEILTTTY